MTSHHAKSTEHLSYLREGPGEGTSATENRHKVEEKAAEVRPDLGEIWSLLQEQWGPCSFCGFTLLQPGSPLTFPHTCQACAHPRALALAVPPS